MEIARYRRDGRLSADVVLYLGGRTPAELGMRVLRESQRPILPSTNDATISIPGRHGEYDLGAYLNALPMPLECAFVAKNSEELQQRASALARFLVDSYGRPRELSLVFRNRPGQKFTVRYSGSLDINRIAGLGLFTLTFIAYDPFAYADQERISEELITESPQDITVETVGNIRTAPVIVLTNEGTTTITRFRIQNEYRLEE